MLYQNNQVETLSDFIDKFKPVHYKKGSVILQADDDLSSILYIKNGYVRAYRISEEGEELTLIILEPGDIFPLACGINESVNEYYLEALSNLEIYRIPKERFMQFIKDDPEIFYQVADNSLGRYRGLLTRMEHLVLGNAYTKIATTILVCADRFGEKQGGNIIVKIPLTQKDIATLAGVTRETTCLEMKKLEKQGIVSHQGKYVIINSLEKLQEESLIHSENSFPVRYL